MDVNQSMKESENGPPEGFVIAFHWEDNGTCIKDPIFNEVIARDGRGRCKLKVCWIEAKEESE